jgi:hypothetical protein
VGFFLADEAGSCWASRFGAEVVCHCQAHVDPESCWVAALDLASRRSRGLGPCGIGSARGKFWAAPSLWSSTAHDLGLGPLCF